MPYNGTGTFTRTDGVASGATLWQSNAANSINNTADRADVHDQDIAAALSMALLKDGQQTPTANLPMGGYKHTGAGVANARSDYALASQVQDSALTYAGASGGTENDYTISLPIIIDAYCAGQSFKFLIDRDNTGASTLNVNAKGAKSIVTIDGSALIAGMLKAGQLAIVTLIGTNFVLETASSVGSLKNCSAVTSSGNLTLTAGASSVLILAAAGAAALQIAGGASGYLIPSAPNQLDNGNASYYWKAVTAAAFKAPTNLDEYAASGYGIRFFPNALTTPKWEISSGGTLEPGTDDDANIGSLSKRVSYGYARVWGATSHFRMYKVDGTYVSGTGSIDTPKTFTTADGKTVTIIGGIVTNVA